MQTKTVLATLFIVLAAALPQPDDISGTVAGHKSSRAEEGTVSTMAQEVWQAKGGCKRDWDEDNRCKSTCIGEAVAGKCTSMKSMAAVLTGGCVPGWKTCECVCEW
jgi:hypothetical protein